MRRSPRVILAWAAALVVVLVTVRVVAGDLGALQRRARSLGADVPVVLAARDLPLGTTLVATDLYTVRRPATTISADALRDPAGALGRVVAVALLRDDVVGARHLAGGTRAGPKGTGAIGIGAIVPKGRRAVHVLVKDGFQPPVGAVVDVLATYDPSLATVSGPAGLAAVVASGAEVLSLAAGAPAAASDAAGTTDTPAGPGVTLLVTEAEARAVAYAATIGVVSLALAPVQAACCPPDGP